MKTKLATTTPRTYQRGMRSTMDHIRVEEGTVIFRQGDLGDKAYLIRSGTVEIIIHGPEGELVLAERGPGEVFGEMAIIDGRPRTATVRAVTNVEMIALSAAQIERRIEATDPVLRLCLNVVMARLRETIDTLSRPVNGGPTLFPPTEPHDATTVAAMEAVKAAIEEIELEHELDAAIRREDFEVLYQPIIDLRSGMIGGFEALLRWNHPERGLISPLVFIPPAEATGLIVPLTRWCFRQAATTLVSLNGAGRDPLFMNVNLSAVDLLEPDLPEQLMAICEATECNPRWMKLEITEGILITSPERATRALTRCREMGFRIALDDFGTGYSSLSYLTKYPINTIKIDRAFIGARPDGLGDERIVDAILSLARQLKMDVVAEGIETNGAMMALASMGCEYGQGWLFSKALPAADLPALFDRWQCIRETEDSVFL